jgi:putative peptide modification target (TIGR04139 family)
MKKLEGLKKDFSSFENNRLSNLEIFKGGLTAQDPYTECKPQCDTCGADGCVDTRHYLDNGKIWDIGNC